MSAMMAAMAAPDPKGKTVTVQVAQFGFTIPLPIRDELKPDVLQLIKEEYIKPVFVRASENDIKSVDKSVQFRIGKVENGSILVTGELIAEVIVTSGVASVATGLLVNILTQRMYTKTEERQYDELMKKLLAITRHYTRQSSVEFYEKQKFTAFISAPKNKGTLVKEFYFDPVDFEEARENLRDAINRYHDGTGKV